MSCNMCVDGVILQSVLDHKKSIVGIGVSAITRSQWDFAIYVARSSQCLCAQICEMLKLVTCCLFPVFILTGLTLLDLTMEKKV